MNYIKTSLRKKK